MKKSHRQSARTPSPKAKRHFSFIKHPFLVLAGTWVFFALVAAVSTEILVHPTGERRITVESSDTQPSKREFNFPFGLYGAIALACTAGSIVVYRRYRQKVTDGSAQIPLPSPKARNRRSPRPKPVAIAPETAQAQYAAPPQKNAPTAPKKRSRQRAPEVLPMTSDGYAPQPLQRQSRASSDRPQVTVMPPRRSVGGNLVESMDVRERQSLDSLLSDTNPPRQRDRRSL